MTKGKILDSMNEKINSLKEELYFMEALREEYIKKLENDEFGKKEEEK